MSSGAEFMSGKFEPGRSVPGYRGSLGSTSEVLRTPHATSTQESPERTHPLLPVLRFVADLQARDVGDKETSAALRGRAIKEVLEMELSDSVEAGITIVGNDYREVFRTFTGRADRYDISIVFPDKDGKPVSLSGDRGIVADTYALARPSDSPEELLAHIDRRMEDVGEWQLEPTYAKYNRFLGEIRASDLGDRSAVKQSREMYIESSIKRAAGIRKAHPYLASELLHVELDEKQLPVRLSLRAVKEDAHAAAERLLGNREELELALAPEAHTTDVTDLGFGIRTRIKKEWDQHRRQYTIHQALPENQTGTAA